MIEIITRQPPYAELQSYEVAVQVVKEKYTHPIPSNTPNGFDKILASCWTYEASQRPSFSDLWTSIKPLAD